MKYIKYVAQAVYCGTENEFYHEYEDRYTESDFEEQADEYCRENAESFEYLVTGWDDDNFETEEEREEALENYRADCTCTWEYITKEEYEENT